MDIIGVNVYGVSIVEGGIANIGDGTFLDSYCITLWTAILAG